MGDVKARGAKRKGTLAKRRGAPDRRATSYDVARLAGVSQSAVSRVFSAGTSVSDTMRVRVEAAAKQLGFTPNLLARGLIKQRSNIVALVITEFTTRYTPQILYHFGIALQSAGLHLLLFTAESEQPSAEVMAQLLDYPVDGVVSCTTLDDVRLDRLATRGVPVVLFNRRSDARRISSVQCDHAAASALIAERLFAAGHRRFAFVSGPADAPVSRERERGFVEALARHGVKRVAREVGDYGYESGRAAGHALARGTARPQAIFCANDVMACGVLDALRHDAGLRVPQDVTVVGFDDVPEAAREAYRLTTLRPPLERMVERTIEILQRRIADPRAVVETVALAAELVERGSARLGAVHA